MRYRRATPDRRIVQTLLACVPIGSVSFPRVYTMGARNHQVTKLAKLAFNFKDYTVERFAEMVGWNLTVINGVLTDECVAPYTGAHVELTR
jgi:tRNA(adenine34) deaminase